MFEIWDVNDIYKALMALAAGTVLGMERELKDKAAGLKTLSVITLGSALFAIISYRIGGPDGEATRISSYVVSGIGFLGAGVIFRDKVDVSGLTTAGVIWLAAAVGLAIGYGEVYLAIIFLASALLVIYFANIITSFFPGAKMSRIITLVMEKNKVHERVRLVQAIAPFLVKYEEKKLKVKDDKAYILLDVTIKKGNLLNLENFLLHCDELVEFEL